MRIGFLAGLVLLFACGDARVGDILELTGDAEAGGVIYDESCAICHGADGLGDIGSDLTERVPLMSDEELIATVLNGLDGTTMPPFAEALDDQSVADVVAYTKSGFDIE